jgi:hypothetical protein
MSSDDDENGSSCKLVEWDKTLVNSGWQLFYAFDHTRSLQVSDVQLDRKIENLLEFDRTWKKGRNAPETSQ